jgi:hypothetical protein
MNILLIIRRAMGIEGLFSFIMMSWGCFVRIPGSRHLTGAFHPWWSRELLGSLWLGRRVVLAILLAVASGRRRVILHGLER